jgi:glycolate oxidase iron-sulfur subunit
MKEYPALFEPGSAWHARAVDLAARTVELTELYAEPAHAAALGAALVGTPDLPQPVTWDDPCHMCHAQGLRAEPRDVLGRVPGLARVELEDAERCCGSAGIYSLVRPADAAAVFEPKLAAFERSGARTLVTGNPGCHIQWHAGLARAGNDARVVHLAELLALSLADAAPGPARDGAG